MPENPPKGRLFPHNLQNKFQTAWYENQTFLSDPIYLYDLLIFSKFPPFQAFMTPTHVHSKFPIIVQSNFIPGVQCLDPLESHPNT